MVFCLLSAFNDQRYPGKKKREEPQKGKNHAGKRPDPKGTPDER